MTHFWLKSDQHAKLYRHICGRWEEKSKVYTHRKRNIVPNVKHQAEQYKEAKQTDDKSEFNEYRIGEEKN